MRPVSRQRFADALGHYPQRLPNCPGRRTSERQTDGARPCAPGPRGGQRSKSLRGKRVDKPQPPPQSPRTKPPGPAALNQQEVAFSALRAEPQDPGARLLGLQAGLLSAASRCHPWVCVSASSFHSDHPFEGPVSKHSHGLGCWGPGLRHRTRRGPGSAHAVTRARTDESTPHAPRGLNAEEARGAHGGGKWTVSLGWGAGWGSPPTTLGPPGRSGKLEASVA